jgi:hypothetical protein
VRFGNLTFFASGSRLCHSGYFCPARRFHSLCRRHLRRYFRFALRFFHWCRRNISDLGRLRCPAYLCFRFSRRCLRLRLRLKRLLPHLFCRPVP